MTYVLAFALAFVFVVALMPAFIKLAHKLDFVDRPNQRKMHKTPVPQLGSLPVYAGFIVTFTLFGGYQQPRLFIGYLVGSLMILSIGLVDDYYKTRGKDFPAFPKFAVQLLAAVVMFLSGAVFRGFGNPFNGEYILLPSYLQFILTVVWIYGVTTVINFIDGLDALSGSITIISAVTLFVVSLSTPYSLASIMAITLVGVSLGYLMYNKPPAKVYYGDSGASFLGFTLSVIALFGTFKQATLLSLFVPILALGVPIFDNILVVYRRIKNGKPPYKADKTHLHHRLVAMGMSPKQTVVVICLINACFSLVAILLFFINSNVW